RESMAFLFQFDSSLLEGRSSLWREQFTGEEESTMVSVFSCYVHEDRHLWNRFEKHLNTLRWIQSWSDRDISAGAERERALDHYLSAADVLLVFISSDFLNSEYST